MTSTAFRCPTQEEVAYLDGVIHERMSELEGFDHPPPVADLLRRERQVVKSTLAEVHAIFESALAFYPDTARVSHRISQLLHQLALSADTLQALRWVRAGGRLKMGRAFTERYPAARFHATVAQ